MKLTQLVYPNLIAFANYSRNSGPERKIEWVICMNAPWRVALTAQSGGLIVC